MIEAGRHYTLPVVKTVDFGVFLDANQGHSSRRPEHVLLPKRYVPSNTKLGDELDVFVYLDSEDQLIATTEEPKITLGECAYLKVTDVNRYGAFLDWGLPKDLLVPFKEQKTPMQMGRSYVVALYQDAQGRLVASPRLNRHLPEVSRYFYPQQAVDLLVCGRTDLGYKVAINKRYLGLLFRDDAFKPLKYGQAIPGYIKGIRDDGKIDVSLQLPPIQQREQLTEQIIAHLQEQGGTSALTDKSAPDDIYNTFKVSKKTYKKALGQLYKERRIVIEPDKITLL